MSSLLFLVFKALRLSQISYIGSNGLFISYYKEGNQTLFLTSNMTDTTARVAQNSSLMYNCSSQQVDTEAGINPYDKEQKINSTILIQGSWLQKALLSSSSGYASLGTGWGRLQEQLVLNTVAIKGLGVVSLGFSVKAITDAISGIDLCGGDLYLFGKDGTILTQTGPYRLSLSNNTVSITVTNLTDNLLAPQTIDITMPEPLRMKNVDICGAKYLIYCEKLDIAGVPSV